MRLESYQLLMLGGISSRIKNGKDGFSSMMNSNGRIYPPVVECVCIVNRLLVCEDIWWTGPSKNWTIGLLPQL